MIVDKLSKYSYIILFKEKYIVEKLGIIMLNRFIQYYKIVKRLLMTEIRFLYLIIKRH